MELFKEIAFGFVIYMTALIISAASMSIFGVESILSKLQFNWIGVIFVGTAFSIWGIHRGKDMKE